MGLLRSKCFLKNDGKLFWGNVFKNFILSFFIYNTSAISERFLHP
jgi:hypothetical protein